MKKNCLTSSLSPGIKRKWGRIMRLTLLLMVGFIFSVSANSYSQTTRLNIDLENQTIINVIEHVEENSEFVFLYKNEDLDLSKKVTINLKNATIDKILDAAFKDQLIDYDVYERQIVLRKAEEANSIVLSAQQQKTIAGVVTDSDGLPLPGVSVVVKNTTIGTVTNGDGSFSLTLPDDAEILQFSFVGMRTQEISVDGRTTFTVVMEEETIGMDEVVVVGYGTQKKVNLTGSVDVISGENLENRSGAKVADLLKGTSPSLNISMDMYGGEPGAESSLNIRGMGSISGNASPLILVDGVEMNIGNIDPETIESVSVLKDASASAIYGSRAPFGVILITTKRGKKGEVSVQYNNNLTANTPFRYPDYVSSLIWATAQNQANMNAGKNPLFPAEQMERIEGYLDGTYPYENDPENPISSMWNGRRQGNANNNWPDILTKDYYFSQKHNINVSGGNENTEYYFSGGYLNQNGFMNFTPDDYYKRYNFLSNFSSQVTDWFTFNTSVKYAKSTTAHPLGYTSVNRENLQGAFTGFAPMAPLHNPNGTYQFPFINLLKKGGTDKIESNDFLLTLGGEIEPVKGWKTRLSYNYNNIGRRRNKNPKPVFVELEAGEPDNIGRSETGVFTQFSNTTYSLYNLLTSYERNLGEHYFKALVGYEQEEKSYSDLEGTGTQLITPNVVAINAALGDKTVEDRLWHWATQGVFGRFNYNYQEKFLLEMSARYNGSSRFAPGKRWGFFPSASAGYNISRENFWSEIEPYINMFKIRGSYGSLGNQNVNNYLYLSRIPVQINDLDWIIDNQRPPYARAPGLISDQLTWETITTLNLGFDMGLLDNRLELGFDWYERITTDMFGPTATLPYLLGAGTPKENNAELSTRGYEIVLKWRDRLSSDFSYNIQVSLGDNKSTILKYKNDKGLIDTWYEGKEVGEIWGYVTDGLIQEEDEPMPDQSYIYSKWGPGDIKYKDLTGDDAIDEGSRTLDDHGDLTVIGNSTPRYNIGIIGGFNWKGFDFNMIWQGIGKRNFQPDSKSNVFWGLAKNYANSGLYKDSWSLDYWRPADETNILGPNTDAYFHKPYFSNEYLKNRETQTRYLLNAGYLRLKNVQLGYTLPQSFSKRIFVQRARVYISGENLILFSSVPENMDPETSFASDPDFGGYKSTGAIYPLSSSLSIGLNLTF